MSHTYTANRVHIVFSTKERRDQVPADMQQRLWAYMGEIARNRGIQVYAIGGTANHVHALVALPALVPLAKAVQAIKGISSKWMNEKRGGGFAWQQGYGAFSVSTSHVETVCEYIHRQPEHHQRHTFEDEFITLLVKHGIAYDPQYVFG